MGVIFRLRNRKVDTGVHIFHPVNWMYHKQHIFSYQSLGAQIIAVADAERHVYNFKFSYMPIFQALYLNNILFIDSLGLHQTITTLYEPMQCRLIIKVDRFLCSFQSGELYGVDLLKEISIWKTDLLSTMKHRDIN